MTNAPLPIASGGSGTGHLLAFTGPTIAFGLAGRTGDAVALRVHLSQESRPPWSTGPADPGLFGFFLLLRMPMARMTRATDDGERMLVAHPAR